ncbi:MAG: C1 family peptidase [Henriciella sp.]
MSDPLAGFSLGGCLVDPNQPAMPIVEGQAGNLPERVDLRQFCSPVENQENTNSCVANAVVSALEMHQIKAGQPLTDMSRLFVYYNSRVVGNMQNQDKGTFVHHAMAALLAHGCCEAKFWPFQKSMVNAKPSQACYVNASFNQAVQFARTSHGQQALTVLAEGLPIVFAMMAPIQYYAIANETGVMPKPDQVQVPPVPTAHAMLMVGYDLTDRTYLVRNSFGTAFGENGYCRIPFETMDVWGMPTQYWTIGAIAQANSLTVTGPSMSSAAEGLGVSVSASVSEPEAGNLDQLRSDIRSRMSSDLETSKRDFRSRLRGK